MLLLLSERFGTGFTLFHDEFVESRIDRQGIMAVKTGETKFIHRSAGGAHHALDIEITEAVDAEIFPDLFHRHLIGDEFLRIGKINPVMAGEAMWRATHAHVNLLRSCLAQIDDTRSRSRAADDGIVYHHDPLSGDH